MLNQKKLLNALVVCALCVMPTMAGNDPIVNFCTDHRSSDFTGCIRNQKDAKLGTLTFMGLLKKLGKTSDDMLPCFTAGTMVGNGTGINYIRIKMCMEEMVLTEFQNCGNLK